MLRSRGLAGQDTIAPRRSYRPAGKDQEGIRSMTGRFLALSAILGLVRSAAAIELEGSIGLAVSNFQSPSSVFIFNGENAEFFNQVDAGSFPRGVTFGPDGRIYAALNRSEDQIIRIDPITGSTSVFASRSGLSTPNDLTFGPDGNLYVASFTAGEVLRFDGSTGEFIDVFVTAGNELREPFGLAFGADGSLFVGTGNTGSCGSPFCNAVLRYDASGSFLEVFVSPNAGGLVDPLEVEFGPDGSLYACTNTPTGGVESIPAILRFDGTTGEFVDRFAEGNSLGDSFRGFDFGPDGNLYVANNARNIPETTGEGILRFDGISGEFIDVFIEGSPWGQVPDLLTGAVYLEFSSVPIRQVADSDLDGATDDLDNCPSVANGGQENGDSDGFGDACDACPFYDSAINSDFDDNGIGDECECGDQTRDSVVNVLDITAINLAIFGAVQVSPLCDANNDQLCNVSDMVAVNIKIFGGQAYCSRYPPPSTP